MLHIIPKIGMRMFKTAVAVFICLFISQFLPYSIPVNSTVTAILCMQPYLSDAKDMSITRIVGASAGGFFGMIALWVFEQYGVPTFYRYLIISLCMIPLIQMTLLIRQPTAAVFTCIVFLSTTLLIDEELPVYLAALHRVIDTALGIVVAMIVNAFELPKGKNREIFFIAELDGTLLNEEGAVTTHTALHLNKMIDEGIWFTIVTDRTPSTFFERLGLLELNLPVIAMEGAALFDLRDQSYAAVTTMKTAESDVVEEIFARHGRNCFVHSVVNEQMHIYYDQLKNIQETNFYHRYRKTNFKSYIRGKKPAAFEAICILAIDEEEVIDTIVADLKASAVASALRIFTKPYGKKPGYTMVEVYSIRASREKAVAELARDLDLHQTVVFGASNHCRGLFEMSDACFAVENASPKLKLAATKVIGSNNTESLIHTMTGIFYRSIFRRKSLLSPSKSRGDRRDRQSR